MCMDVCVLFPRSALSCMEMTNDRHPVSLLKNVFPLWSRGSVSHGLHSFPNSSQTSCLSLEPNMHTCFGGAIGRWVTIPHHKYSSLKRVCKCACTFRTLCITVLFNHFRKVDMLFNTGYEFVKLLFFSHWICQSWFLIVNARARTEKEVAGGKWSSPLSTHEQARSSW